MHSGLEGESSEWKEDNAAYTFEFEVYMRDLLSIHVFSFISLFFPLESSG